MENLKNSLKEIEKLGKFKEFKKENKKSYLSGAFLNEHNVWEFDFYCPEKHKITTFYLDNELIIKPAEKIFQKEEKLIHEVDLDKVKINLNKALEIVEEEFKKKKTGELVNKKIIILQNLDGTQVWNITYLTSSFNILNMKIDIDDGKIVHEVFESILNLRSK